MNWNIDLKESVDSNRAKQFFDKLELLCKEMNVSIAHEDRYGSFELNGNYDPELMIWMRGANLYNWEEVK